MFLTCICSILKYQNHSFEKCNTLEHTNLGDNCSDYFELIHMLPAVLLMKDF